MNDTPEKPAASVILPVFNAEKYIDTAIESVLDQGNENFELLLLNDGSTDGSSARLEYFAARDERCKIYSWPNRGLIETLNAGIRLASAEILIRMDADDICLPDRFAKQIAFMEDHAECVALGSCVMLIDPEGCPLGKFETKLDHEGIDSAHLAGKGGSIAHPSVVMRKDAILRVGGYRADYPHAEDIDLFLRLAEVGQLANLDEVLLEYRQHPSSIGYRHARIQQESARRAVIAAYDRRGLELPPSFAHLCSSDNPASLADIHRKWGWWALNSGNRKTARKHAWKALSLAPFEKDNLKLCACVLRGH